jgi:hypothetical protein
MNTTQKSRLYFDYDNLFHGHAQDLKVGDKFSHNEGHIWEVVKTPEIFPTGTTYNITAKRLTGYPKQRAFNFGRFATI